MLALGAAVGLPLPGVSAAARSAVHYDVAPVGNVHLLHLTDVHAQLLPIYFREPSVNIGVHAARNRPPHLVGQALLDSYGIPADSRRAHAFTHLNFEAGAADFGRVGGFAHLATLIKKLKASRPGALLLDGGDLWQGSATALWTRGQDMVEASKLLGIDVMTGHWEFTLGAERVQDILRDDLAGHIDFLAQNVRNADFGDPVFPGHTLREMNGVSVAIIGQAFPYTPIANPAHLIEGWSFGIREADLQAKVDELRSAGAEVVVLLSHNGADTDIKLASRVTGIDAILGGHTHDALPRALEVRNSDGVTLVTNAGSNGKFVGVLDFDVRRGGIKNWSYKLLPVFADLLPPDPEMEALITRFRAPYIDELSEVLAITDDLLYRRGNFSGSFDQLICNALQDELGTEIALSPGFRWGTSLLPGSEITMEDLMAQVAITYPAVTRREFSGGELKATLEDVADNLFNPDPYRQQGGDMVRVGGLSYGIDPRERFGHRIHDMRLNGKPIDAAKSYSVAGWASVRPTEGEPIWDVVSRWLKDQKTIGAVAVNRPSLAGVQDNLGIAQ